MLRAAAPSARGARVTEAELFNGDYYEHHVRPPGTADNVAEGLRIRYAGDSPDVGSDDLVDPDLQLGPGCASDQVVGDTVALMAGLSTGLDREHVRTALTSVHRFNPARPFPYAFEVWTGLEYSAATGLALAGERSRAREIVADLRAPRRGAAEPVQRDRVRQPLRTRDGRVRAAVGLGAHRRRSSDERADRGPAAPQLAGGGGGVSEWSRSAPAARYEARHGPPLEARIRCEPAD